MSVRGSQDLTEQQREGLRLIDNDDMQGATIVLKSAAMTDESGETHALLGLIDYRKENYDGAAQHYLTALKAQPTREDWRQMADRARANALAEVNVAVPEPRHFERDKLLAIPDVPPHALPPASSELKHKRRIGDWTRKILGMGLGNIASEITIGGSWLVGNVMGYKDRVWTNWYRRKKLLGILTLAHMRAKLNKENLKSTYPNGTKVGFMPDNLEPPEGVTHFRTADGSWNNLDDPKEGAAGTRFPRNVNNDAIHANENLLEPNPRLISLKLLSRREKMKEVPFLNMLAASWIQFQNHDWVSHGENISTDLIEVPMPSDDPAREQFHQDRMFVGRTQPDPTRHEDQEETPVTFVNEVTHWWDGSQIYGSDQQTVDHLRTGVDGKMKVNDDGTLPLDKKGIEETGMVRNWWLGLAMLHNVFTREHNAICDHLKKHYPHWDDNRLFNIARLVNAAVMAKIHTVEWTPAVLPNPGLDSGLNANWYGLATNYFKKGKERKTFADINVRNPEVGGVVGNWTNKYNSPYGLTEEFVEVYRLHSFLPETLQFKKVGSDEVVETVPFVASRQAGSGKITQRTNMSDLFYSFGTQHPGQLVLNNYPKFMQELSIPGNPVFDLGAIDILRARERGVPRYNEFRRQLGLNPIETFADLTDDKEQVSELAEVYGDDVEKLDLLVGTLAEGHRPTGFGFGETLFQIFILNATRRLQADRFFTVDYREEIYSKEGMEWVDKTIFKDVLLRHYPELAETGLANIKNAFEPWDTGAELDPSRHPLRAYDSELKHNPWEVGAVPYV